MTDNIDSALKSDIIFERDSYEIWEQLRNRNFQILLASCLEKYPTAKEFGVTHLSIAFPMYDRLIVERTYAGFRTGNVLIEDISSKFIAPL